MNFPWEDHGNVLALTATGVIWGVTNPLIKRGTTGVERVGTRGGNLVTRTIRELLFLVSNLQFVLPFLLNQCGSLLYYYKLQSSDIALAVPLTNSLAFLFTAITGWFLNERPPDSRTFVGMALIFAGVTCLIVAKV